MGAISGGLEKIWNKKQFSSTPPSNLNYDWSLRNTNFRLFELLVFFGVERRFFFLEYRETHLPGVFSRKQKDGKIDHFRPKPWTNPLGKF